MRLRNRHLIGKLGAVTTVLLLILSATSSSGYAGAKEGSGDSGTPGKALPNATGPIGAPVKTGSPVKGGVLRVAVGTDPGGLDPVKNTMDGSTGLTELTAIYDSLVRFDPKTNEYVPQLAKSVTANADSTVYTIRLRPNVTFTDGTPLNSAAVKSGFERFSGPDSIQVYFAIFGEIASMETPDDLTVVVNLVAPDPSFQWLLTQGFGIVPSPTAIEQMGEEAFNLKPVGAGPFMVKSYTPGSGLTLVRNPHYWGTPPPLDGIKFTWPVGDQAKVQALDSGDLDLVKVQDPVAATSALQSGKSGLVWLRYGYPVVAMNERDGRPFADVRVRKAFAYALDADVLNTRVYKGLGYPSKDLFPSGLLSSGVKGIKAQPKKARQLLQEVKDETGWGGSFSITVNADPTYQQVGLTVQAMLNNVGFKAVVDTAPSGTAFSDNVYVKYDYDVAIVADQVLETDPWALMVFYAANDFSPTGFKDPKMDPALTALQAASTEKELRAATAQLQKLWNEFVPEVWLGVNRDAAFWDSGVHGVLQSASSAVLLDKAWLKK